MRGLEDQLDSKFDEDIQLSAELEYGNGQI